MSDAFVVQGFRKLFHPRCLTVVVFGCGLVDAFHRAHRFRHAVLLALQVDEQAYQHSYRRSGDAPRVGTQKGEERLHARDDASRPQHFRLVGNDGNVYRCRVQPHRRSGRDDDTPVVVESLDERKQPLYGQAAEADEVLHHRLQPFAQLYPHFLEAFACLLQPGLHGVVLHVVFVGDARAFGKSLVGVLLLTAHQVYIACQGTDDACRFGSAELHFFQHRCDLRHAAHLVESLQERDDRCVDIGLHQPGELLHIHLCQPGILCRLLVDA